MAGSGEDCCPDGAFDEQPVSSSPAISANTNTFIMPPDLPTSRRKVIILTERLLNTEAMPMHSHLQRTREAIDQATDGLTVDELIWYPDGK